MTKSTSNIILNGEKLKALLLCKDAHSQQFRIVGFFFPVDIEVVYSIVLLLYILFSVILKVLATAIT